MTRCKLSPLALGLSLGFIWGAAVLLMGILAHYFAYGNAFVDAMGVVYIGYDITISGSIIGAVFGFIDALVSGVLIAWLYNVFSSCGKRKCGSCDTEE
jgi:hypothetical protein